MAETRSRRPPELEVSRRYRPSQVAVALAYNDGAHAPRVVAKGRGIIAQTIIERAREAGVYVHESSELVTLLMQLDLDESIPPELYRAVAEVLAFVHMLERKANADQDHAISMLADLFKSGQNS